MKMSGNISDSEGFVVLNYKVVSCQLPATKLYQLKGIEANE